MASRGESFPAVDAEKELNPQNNKEFQVDSVSSQVASSIEKENLTDKPSAARSEEASEEVVKFPRTSSHVVVTFLDFKPKSRSRFDTIQFNLKRERFRVFEGESGIAAGDVAYRITAEASDVADTVYSLF
ncbi:hypothetical protein HAX54_017725 [Datura stramonium]|uniref:Uncharacterized protein n=1 Tax=Datura stramonium TaxID=4076 RepID=A0ABS8S0N7_DATST|nr:hypothetical protein [Datura stramonium]